MPAYSPVLSIFLHDRSLLVYITFVLKFIPPFLSLLYMISYTSHSQILLPCFSPPQIHFYIFCLGFLKFSVSAPSFSSNPYPPLNALLLQERPCYPCPAPSPSSAAWEGSPGGACWGEQSSRTSSGKGWRRCFRNRNISASQTGRS